MAWKLDLTAELPQQEAQEEERQPRRSPKLGLGFVLLAAVAALVYGRKGPTVDDLPGSLEFGSHPVQSVAPEQFLNPRNGGSADLHVKTALVGGQDASDFQLVNVACLGQTTTPGQTCSITVRFQPLAAGRRQAKLILVDDAGTSPQSVDLAGIGIARPDLTVTPSAVSFPEQLKGNVSDWLQVSLHNVGGAPVKLSAIELADTAGTFALDSGLCLQAPLAAGEVCDVRVRFTPAEATSYTARLIIRDSTGDAPHEIALTGNGRERAVANARVTPSPLDFGMQPLEKTAVQTVSVVSTGNIPLRTGTIQISGEGADEFVADNHCAHTELAPGGECRVRIRFTPRAQGKHQAQLLLSSEGGENLQSVALLGYGEPPSPVKPPRNPGTPTAPAVTRVVVHPEKYRFDRQEALTPSRPVTVTLTSTGDAPARVQKFYTQGNSSGEFAVKDVNCAGRTLATNQECNLSVVFAPKAMPEGSSPERSAELVIDVADTSPARVALSGTTSVPPPSVPSPSGFLVSPGDIDFGDAQLGQQSTPRVITVTNSGSAPLPVLATLPPNSRGEFRVVHSDCPDSVIPARGSCRLTLAFTPQRVGATQTEVTMSSASPVQVESVRLRGRALPEPPPQASFILKPQEIAFGGWPVGGQSEPRTIALINPGAVAISIHATMTNQGEFRVVAGNCRNQEIPARGSCELTLLFAPRDVGSRQTSLTIASASQVQSAYLTGTGLTKTTPERLFIKPGALEFGEVPLGSQSPTRQVTLANPGTAPVAFRATLSSGDFRVLGSDCHNSMVPARGNCTIALAFAPQDAGRRQSDLALISSSQQQAVRLSGSGTRKSVPPPPQYGWCCVGRYSAARISRSPGYSLVKSTPNDCAQQNGKFFTNYRTATASCKAPPPSRPIGWNQPLWEPDAPDSNPSLGR